jgi:hypothetical protein
MKTLTLRPNLSLFLSLSLSQIGIEAGFYTIKTAFSSPTSVQEGLEIVRRTGAKVRG